VNKNTSDYESEKSSSGFGRGTNQSITLRLRSRRRKNTKENGPDIKQFYGFEKFSYAFVQLLKLFY